MILRHEAGKLISPKVFCLLNSNFMSGAVLLPVRLQSSLLGKKKTLSSLLNLLNQSDVMKGNDLG